MNRIPSRLGRVATIIILAAGASVALGQDVVTIKVQGQGIDKPGAINDALRKAVEQGGKNEIASRTKTKDFALEYDIVLSRASGLVKDYKVLSSRTRDGITTVEIEAQVSKTLIDATWADVAIQLKALGRPKIMVVFTEAVHDLDRPERNREIVQRDSILAARIERKLQKLGFKLVSPNQVKAIEKKQLEKATLEDDMAAIQAIASRYGAAVCLTGVSRATGPQRTTAAGIDLYMWETDATIRAFWTETADMIFTNSKTGIRSGSRVAGPIGGRKALEKTGEKLAEATVYDLLEAWTRGTAGGVGDIIIEVSNIAGVRQAIAIKKALATIQGVEDVTRDGVKGNVRYTVSINMGAEEFLEHLIELSFDGFELDVEDQKMKTIVCKIK